MKKAGSLLRANVPLAFVAAFLILLVVAGVSYRGIVVSRESDRLVRHTHEVLENLEALLFANATIESTSRGFVLTGSESYLDAYADGRSRAEDFQATLRTLTADNPDQQDRLRAIQSLIAERILFADKVIALGREGRYDAAATEVRTGRGEAITTEFQRVVRQLQDEEQRLLVGRNADAEQQLTQTTTVLILGTVVGLLITAAAAWSVRRDNARRGRAEDALRVNVERDATGNEESAAKYRGLLEAAPDAMVVVNQAGDIVLVNVQAEKQFGYRRDELLGQQVTNIIPEGFAERLIADDLRSADDALAQQIGTGIELIGSCARTAREFPIEIMFSPPGERRGDSGDRGHPGHQRRARRPRLATEVSWRRRPMRWLWSIRPVRSCFSIVQAEKKFGYHRDELRRVSRSPTSSRRVSLRRLIADDLRSAEDALAQQIGTGIELSARAQGRIEFPIELMLSPLEFDRGNPCDGRDSRHNRSQEQRRSISLQMEGRYRGLLEAAPDAMVVVNQAGEIVLLNLQAEKQFGYRRDELVGQQVNEHHSGGLRGAARSRTTFDRRRMRSPSRSAPGIELIGPAEGRQRSSRSRSC